MTDTPGKPLDFAGLGERIVPLVAELFATLASQNPLRMHFADIAEKTLLDIVDALRQDGMSQEAVAASLGLTINGYRAKVKRLRELYRDGGAITDAADEPRTLLERVFGYVDELAAAGSKGEARFIDIADRFRGVKPDSLKGVLSFLVKSGHLETSGRGMQRSYRVVTRPTADGGVGYEDAAVMLYREGPLSIPDLAVKLGRTEEQCTDWVTRLQAADRLRVVESKGVTRYHATDYHIPLDTAVGYEAAIWDHLAAVIGAICKKVRVGRHAASLGDRTGGATFSFYVPVDDPMWDDVTGYLERTRVKLEGWLEQAREIEASGDYTGRRRKVTIYVGQVVEEMDS